MQASAVERAVAAATSIASELDLAVNDAVVLQNSNNLALRLLPCEVFARIAPQGQHVAAFEVDLAQRLAQTGSPIATLERRAAPRVYERDGFVLTFWTYYPSFGEIAPARYAEALKRLHGGLQTLTVIAPHFTDRVAEAQRLVASQNLSPALGAPDRQLVVDALSQLKRAIAERGAAEQLLHGEPHPGNLLNTKDGPIFIDLETCCRGPVEFDLAHTPEAVASRYPGADPELLDDCRGLVLAMVAAWRWDARDQFPNGRRVGEELLRTLKAGAPWPTLDVMMERLAGS